MLVFESDFGVPATKGLFLSKSIYVHLIVCSAVFRVLRWEVTPWWLSKQVVSHSCFDLTTTEQKQHASILLRWVIQWMKLCRKQLLSHLLSTTAINISKKKLPRYVIGTVRTALTLQTQILTNLKTWHGRTSRIDDLDGRIGQRVLVRKPVRLLISFAYRTVSHQQSHLQHWNRTVAILTMVARLESLLWYLYINNLLNHWFGYSIGTWASYSFRHD